MYNIIPLIIILICLAIILAIILKKLPLLTSFDTSEIPEEKQSETKEKIMNERLKRKAKFVYGKVTPFGQLIVNFWQRKSGAAIAKLKDLEEQYKKKTTKETVVTKEEFENLENRIGQLLAEAENLTAKEEYSEAEKKYIEIISIDAKSAKAYHGLGQLYFLMKNNDEAIQTLEHILKLNSKDAQAYFELAEIFVKLEKYDKALKNLDKALKFEPNNPKYLDLSVSVNIARKDKKGAREALARLSKVNPENQKIGEFDSQIKEL